MGARGGNGGLATTAAGLISAGERVVPRPPRPPPWGCGLSSLRGSQPVSSEHDRELLRAARGGRASAQRAGLQGKESTRARARPRPCAAPQYAARLYLKK